MAISDHNLPYPTYFGTLCPQTHCQGCLPHPNWRHRVGKSAKAGVKKAPIFQCSVACYCEHPFFQGNCAWAEILSRLSLSHKGMMLRIAKYAFFRVLLSANWTKEPQTGCIFNTLLQPLQGPLSDIAHLDCVGDSRSSWQNVYAFIVSSLSWATDNFLMAAFYRASSLIATLLWQQHFVQQSVCHWKK